MHEVETGRRKVMKQWQNSFEDRLPHPSTDFLDLDPNIWGFARDSATGTLQRVDLVSCLYRCLNRCLKIDVYKMSKVT